MIPPLLHQIWLQGLDHFKTNRAEEYQWSLELQAVFHDWTYRLWTEDELKVLIQDTYPQLLPLWKAAPHKAFIADLGRLAVLHKHGGMYLDTDYMILKRFSHLFQPETEFACVRYDSWREGESFLAGGLRHNNCFMASIANSSIIGEVAAEMVKFGPYRSPGSGIDYAIQCSLLSYDRVVKRHAQDPGFLVISNEVLEPLHSFSQHRRCHDTQSCREEFPSAFAAHMGAGSWVPGDSTVKAILKGVGYLGDWWWIELLVLGLLSVVFIVLFAVYCHRYRRCLSTKKHVKHDVSPTSPEAGTATHPRSRRR